MFKTAIEICADEEQYNKWMPLANNLDIIGSYAQTEIGHGSDVQNIKTTATYDHAKKEFVIHTPSLDATKWWPGDMGRTSNFALVLARIIIPDPEDPSEVNDYGLGMFLVQCRCLDTHKFMPGIKCGEIGYKIGYQSKDNGWMTFDNVRIPKNQMLSRFQVIDDDGCYSLTGDPRHI